MTVCLSVSVFPSFFISLTIYIYIYIPMKFPSLIDFTFSYTMCLLKQMNCLLGHFLLILKTYICT